MIAAIIAEYNPLHNGHIYHIAKTRELLRTKSTDSRDYVIVVMSGGYCQRGEVCILNKYTRARHALLSGADMVIELPGIYATSSAQYFAFGAMALLNKIKGLSMISCGSESGDINKLRHLAELTQTNEYNNSIRQFLSAGNSYPKSAQLALDSMGISDYTVFSAPNNTLAIEYIRQAKQFGLDDIIETVKRSGAGYHDINTDNSYISATAVRHSIQTYKTNSIKDKIPDCVFNDIEKSGINYDKLLGIIAAKALSANEVYEDGEGIINRIKASLRIANSYDELVDLTHTKRYTKGKIRRILLHLALGFVPSDIDIPLGKVKILGVREDARSLLSLIDNSGNDWHIQQDIYASKIYNIVSNDKICSDRMLIIK